LGAAHTLNLKCDEALAAFPTLFIDRTSMARSK
jgi:hypothetical protein